jgi:hypothetical protein
MDKKYKDITLKFGKYYGETLETVLKKDPSYLKWLEKSYEITDKTTPTMKAILKFCKSV